MHQLLHLLNDTWHVSVVTGNLNQQSSPLKSLAMRHTPHSSHSHTQHPRGPFGSSHPAQQHSQLPLLPPPAWAWPCPPAAGCAADGDDNENDCACVRPALARSIRGAVLEDPSVRAGGVPSLFLLFGFFFFFELLHGLLANLGVCSTPPARRPRGSNGSRSEGLRSGSSSAGLRSICTCAALSPPASSCLPCFSRYLGRVQQVHVT